jgi:hypothetical protein
MFRPRRVEDWTPGAVTAFGISETLRQLSVSYEETRRRGMGLPHFVRYMLDG